MPNLPPTAHLPGHEVTNQPEPRGDLALWGDDPALQAHAAAAGAQLGALESYAATIGTAQMQEAGIQANRHPPELLAFDAGGRRHDEVRYHPDYHRLLETGLSAGYAAIPWDGGAGGHATHAAMVYLTTQIEPGVCCPMTMTYAAVPALKADADLFAAWVPKLIARAYVGRVFDAGAGAGRADLFRGAALARPWAQRDPSAAAQGQAGQPGQCLRRDRV